MKTKIIKVLLLCSGVILITSAQSFSAHPVAYFFVIFGGCYALATGSLL